HFARANRPQDGHRRARRRQPKARCTRNRARARPRLEQFEARRLLSLTINASFDDSIKNDKHAAEIEATINRTVADFESLIADNITVDIQFVEVADGLGGSNSKPNFFENYQDYYNALVSH